MSQPLIIQGGMGAGVSNWHLARSVSKLSQLGVVSGTALDVILARRLQQGDPDGDIRRALSFRSLAWRNARWITTSFQAASQRRIHSNQFPFRRNNPVRRWSS